jgi:hypothetical protein
VKAILRLIKEILRHWQALICLLFLGAVFYYAGEKRGDALIAFALPLILGVTYMIIMFFSSDDETKNQDDLLTRLGAVWMKLTMPKHKKKGPPS